MGLENVRKGLVQEAQAEARRLLSQAEKRAAEITAEAKEKASKAKAQARERAKQAAEAMESERTSAAQLKANKVVAEAANRKMDEALEKAWEEFAKTPESKDYEKIMKTLITGAEKELGAKAMVHVNARDAKIAGKFSKNVAAKPVNIAGGAIITNADGRISIDNSLESMFGQGKEEAKKVIYSELLGGRGK